MTPRPRNISSFPFFLYNSLRHLIEGIFELKLRPLNSLHTSLPELNTNLIQVVKSQGEIGYGQDLSYLRLCKGYLFVMGNSRMITHEIQKDISHLMSIGDFYVSPCVYDM